MRNLKDVQSSPLEIPVSECSREKYVTPEFEKVDLNGLTFPTIHVIPSSHFRGVRVLALMPHTLFRSSPDKPS